jgi:quinol monooxygenase YgiN
MLGLTAQREETFMSCMGWRVAPRISFFAYALGLMLLAAVPDARAQQPAQPPAGPIYSVTSIDVGADASGQAIAVLKQYRDAARKQPGNQGADVLQEIGAPYRFVVYESWADQAAFDTNDKGDASKELTDKLKAISPAPSDRRAYRGVSVAAAKAPKGPGAVYLHVHLDVLPPGIGQTLASAKQLADASRKGDGNLRWDVVQSTRGAGNHHTIYAAWESRKDFDEFLVSRAELKFRDAIAPLLGSPYDDRLYSLID